MAQTSLLPVPKQQFLDENGDPYSGGKIYFYEPGTTTAKVVYSDSNGTTALANPVILDSAGRAAIWLNGFYKSKLTDANDAEIWTIDNVSSQYSAGDTDSQFILQGDTLTFSNATQFTLPTDKTATYEAGRRIKAVVTAGTIYGTITASSSAGAPAVTTVTSLFDSGSLDNGLSSVFLGINTVANTSLPRLPVLPKTANYTVDVVDYGKKITMSANGVELTLPTANSVYSGFLIDFVNVGANQMTLTGTVNGFANVTFLQYESAALFSDGSNWYSENMHNNDPVGTVKMWHKSLSGVPQTLPWGFIECTGQAISDSESPLNGQTAPNINADGRFVRGSNTSGTEQANQNLEHTHTPVNENILDANGNATYGKLGSGAGTPLANYTAGAVAANFVGLKSSALANSGAAEARPDNISMVFIMKIK